METNQRSSSNEFFFNTSNVPKPLKLNLRSKVKDYMKHNGYFLDMEFLHVIISFLFFVVYIADAYSKFIFYSGQSNPQPENSFSISDQHIQFMLQSFYVCDLILCSLTVLLWFVSFLLRKNKLRYLYHPYTIVDFIIVAPMIPLCAYILYCIQHYGFYMDKMLIVNRNQSELEDIYFHMFNISVVISIFRLTRLVRIIFVLTWKKNLLHYVLANSFGFGPTLKVQIACLIILVVTLVVLFSGIFQQIEFLVGGAIVSLHDSLYFIILSMATVGDSGITPTNAASKYWIIACILAGAAIIPYRLSQILSTSEKAMFRARNANLRGHIIVCGYFRKQHVLDFLKEFYHSMHGKNNKKALIVSRNKQLCESILETIKARQYLQEKVLVFNGDLMDYETSLILRIQEAHSVFLLNCIKHSNPRHNDTSIMVTTIGLKNFNPNLDIYAQVTLPESRAYLYKAGAKVVVCTETISSKIMGLSVVYHGFSTLIVNLVSTIYVRNALETYKKIMDNKKNKSWIPFLKKKADPLTSSESLWTYEYLDGLGNELYCVKLSPFFEGMVFMKAVIFIRETFNITLIALEYLDNDENLSSISLNPFDEVIHVEKCKVFVIAKSTFHANLLYLFDNTKAENNSTSPSPTVNTERPMRLYNTQPQDRSEMESFEAFFISEENEYEKSVKEGSGEESKAQPKAKAKLIPTRKKWIRDRRRIPLKRGVKTLGKSQSTVSFSPNAEKHHEDDESPSILTHSSDLDSPISFVSGRSGDEKLIDFQSVPHVSETELSKGFLLRLFRSVAPPTFFYKKSGDSTNKNFVDDFYRSVLDNYNLLTNPRPKEDFFLSSASSLDIKNHIILVGELKYPLVILSTIRSIRKKQFSPIVIMVSHSKLHGNPYVDYLYDRLKFFDQVFFLKGNATDAFDLHRSGLPNAELVVYLSRQTHKFGMDDFEGMDDLLDSSKYIRDSEVIKIVEAICYIDSKKFFIMELENQKNLKFLKQGGCFSKKYGENHSLLKIFQNLTSAPVAFDDPFHSLSDKRDEYDQFYMLSELYSSGRVFPISFIPKLLAKSFYTDKLNDIIEQMSLDGFCTMSKSSIFQEDCPESCYGRTVMEIFPELCEVSNLILIALYRPKRILTNGILETVDKDFYYVYTNPGRSVILAEGDKIFLCGRKSAFADFVSHSLKTKGIPQTHQDHLNIIISGTQAEATTQREASPITSRLSTTVHNILSSQSFDKFLSRHAQK